MAKKRKTTRRRRVGAINKSGLVATLGGIAVGALAARFVGTKLLSKLDPKISSGIQAAAGVFLTMQKSPVLKGVGMGMFGSGIVSAGQSFNLIAGVPSRSSYLQNEYPDEMPVISGSNNDWNYLGNPQNSPDMNVISGVGNPAGDAQFSVIAGGENLVF
jgi:hypothetical protein